MESRRHLTRSGALDAAAGLLAGAGAVALVTAAVAVLDRWVPALSLGALYVLAVLPVAVVWGVLVAVPVAVASMLAFNFFELPPRHTLHLREGADWLALVVYLAVALAVSWLAARARRRAEEAAAREQEAALLAGAAARLLGATSLDEELEAVRGEAEAAVAAGLVEPQRLLPALADLLELGLDRERLELAVREAEAVRRSDAMKTAILRSVSHDLRSPLTAVTAAAGALASPQLALSADDRDQLVATVVAEARRLERLVAGLLDLSRLQAGAARPVREPHAVDELVANALDDLDGEARVQVAVPDDLPPVLVDVVQLRRALANVLENALVHGGPDGAVTVTAEPGRPGEAGELGTVRLLVRDRGPGIAPAEAQAVFEPFRKGRAGAAGHGSGLGLAIARGFVEAGGGTLELGPAPAGGGALLVLELPVAAPLPVATPLPVAAPALADARRPA